MSVKLTIHIDVHTEQYIKALARRKNTTISKLIEEFVYDASKKEIAVDRKKGLGTILRAPEPLLPNSQKSYKAILGEIREENFSKNK